MNAEVTGYIQRAPGEQKRIMKTIRSIIHKQVDGVIEEFKWKRPVFKLTKHFAYLQSNKNHVTLGFYYGSGKLDDPNGLLEGTGKMMRHIKFTTVADIDSKIIQQWIIALTR